MKKSNTYLVKSVGVAKLPLFGKLCAVDTANKKFKLGRLTFLFENEIPITDIKEFLEEFLTLKIDTLLEDEYYEHVKIDFVNSKTTILDENIDNFIGAVVYNDIGIVLKVGVEFPRVEWDAPTYVFRYYPHNLSISSNNFNLLELTNKV